MRWYLTQELNTEKNQPDKCLSKECFRKRDRKCKGPGVGARAVYHRDRVKNSGLDCGEYEGEQQRLIK